MNLIQTILWKVWELNVLFYEILTPTFNMKQFYNKSENHVVLQLRFKIYFQKKLIFTATIWPKTV